ncbi:hypothetical protein BH09ACT7_BH09ACT7_42370 [soil metagenome]
MVIKSTPFADKNGKSPFNASGVVEVSSRRFVFIDNRDPSALFEFALDSDDEVTGHVQRRPLTGVGDGELRDPEGIARLEGDGEVILIASSSLCMVDGVPCDGLVRTRYTPHGGLHAELMPGFRSWLLHHEPSLAASGGRPPDAGGLNIEGLAWDPRAGALIFGIRGPGERGGIAIIRVPVDAGSATWTTASLGTPVVTRLRIPRARHMQGVRDISYDDEAGEFLILIGRSTSSGDAPFRLCTWNGSSDRVSLLDSSFHRSMKPEGVTTFRCGRTKMVLVVDDRGGYAVLDSMKLRQ